jgi:hypothetical protein
MAEQTLYNTQDQQAFRWTQMRHYPISNNMNKTSARIAPGQYTLSVIYRKLMAEDSYHHAVI